MGQCETVVTESYITCRYNGFAMIRRTYSWIIRENSRGEESGLSSILFKEIEKTLSYRYIFVSNNAFYLKVDCFRCMHNTYIIVVEKNSYQLKSLKTRVFSFLKMILAWHSNYIQIWQMLKCNPIYLQEEFWRRAWFWSMT